MWTIPAHIRFFFRKYCFALSTPYHEISNYTKKISF